MSNTAKSQLTNQSIGAAIAKQRKACGITQAQLAERLELSIDAISRLERGNIALSVARLVKLAEIFDCELVDLLDEASNRPRDQARKLESMLMQLDEQKRQGLLQLIEQMIEWQK
ncbi:helix-turn-helix domain-containing protein [Avibacterium sp. 20-129]|uniref:helix-turn-helix domain-containing protein n=1 Tax=Avibacterium sp. 20-129 TaxID=2911525 RepID=UPI0022454FAF|nr:helix-turn-helix transcriptional regulator [Avibacterium sp. 20-129]MCW9699118.1 helix-turn-helix domain-containing protein [Avibacterium sp. 20-129]